MGTITDIRIPAIVRGVIFDYGGTLDSRGDHWSHIILDGYRKAGVEISAAEFIPAYIHGERALAIAGVVCATDTFMDVMRKKIDAELEFLNIDGSGGLTEAIAAYCYGYARGCIEEVSPVLRRLAGSYPLVLVSNFYGNINAVIADFGISDCFKAVIESAAVGVRKPDPAIFRLGLEALGLRAEEVLVIGDSLDKDILPARSLGCLTWQVEGREWPPV
ncbi:MAG: HAD family hydrolase [Staphylococcus sp.]|nr:HAD family hydrolase [Staphylococcus sp.]